MEKRPGTADTGRKLSFTEAVGNGGKVPDAVIHPCAKPDQRMVWFRSLQLSLSIGVQTGPPIGVE